MKALNYFGACITCNILAAMNVSVALADDTSAGCHIASGGYQLVCYDKTGASVYSNSFSNISQGSNPNSFSSNFSTVTYNYDPDTNKFEITTTSKIDGTTKTEKKEYTYDNQGKQHILNSETNTNGYKENRSYTYDENGRQLTNTYSDSNGRTSSYQSTYNDDGKALTSNYQDNYSCLSGVCKGYSYTQEFTYDENGKQIARDYVRSDGYEENRSYTYDENGRQLTNNYSDTSGYEYGYSYTYDENGHKLTEEFSNSRGREYAYEYEYDENGRKTAESYYSSGGALQYWQYDENGRQIGYVNGNSSSGWMTVEDENGNSKVVYGKPQKDEDGLLYFVTKDSSGNSKSYVLDGTNTAGVVECASGKTNCSANFYDDQGRVVAQYDQNNKPVKSYDYDDNGNTMVYNDNCRAIEKYDPSGNTLPLPYQIGDGLYSANRKKAYTPAEATRIVKNSENNSLILYFK